MSALPLVFFAAIRSARIFFVKKVSEASTHTLTFMKKAAIGIYMNEKKTTLRAAGPTNSSPLNIWSSVNAYES